MQNRSRWSPALRGLRLMLLLSISALAACRMAPSPEAAAAADPAARQAAALARDFYQLQLDDSPGADGYRDVLASRALQRVRLDAAMQMRAAEAAGSGHADAPGIAGGDLQLRSSRAFVRVAEVQVLQIDPDRAEVQVVLEGAGAEVVDRPVLVLVRERDVVGVDDQRYGADLPPRVPDLEALTPQPQAWRVDDIRDGDGMRSLRAALDPGA